MEIFVGIRTINPLKKSDLQIIKLLFIIAPPHARFLIKENDIRWKNIKYSNSDPNYDKLMIYMTESPVKDFIRWEVEINSKPQNAVIRSYKYNIRDGVNDNIIIYRSDLYRTLLNSKSTGFSITCMFVYTHSDVEDVSYKVSFKIEDLIIKPLRIIHIISREYDAYHEVERWDD